MNGGSVFKDCGRFVTSERLQGSSLGKTKPRAASCRENYLGHGLCKLLSFAMGALLPISTNAIQPLPTPSERDSSISFQASDSSSREGKRGQHEVSPRSSECGLTHYLGDKQGQLVISQEQVLALPGICQCYEQELAACLGGAALAQVVFRTSGVLPTSSLLY